VNQIRDNITLVWDGLTTARSPPRAGIFHAMHFHVCRNGTPARWTVLVEGQVYGEYLDIDQAVADAVEAAMEAQEAGRTAQVWEGGVRVF
jgi:hypothetical protein